MPPQAVRICVHFVWDMGYDIFIIHVPCPEGRMFECKSVPCPREKFAYTMGGAAPLYMCLYVRVNRCRRHFVGGLRRGVCGRFGAPLLSKGNFAFGFFCLNPDGQDLRIETPFGCSPARCKAYRRSPM
jgi:hypothetical protein